MLNAGSAWMALVIIGAILPGCLGPGCPSSWNAAHNPDFLSTLPNDYVVADAIAIRFVGGYDLDVLERVDGERLRPLFLRVDEPIAGIGPRDRVLVIAREEGADGIVIVPGMCPPLQRLPNE